MQLTTSPCMATIICCSLILLFNQSAFVGAGNSGSRMSRSRQPTPTPGAPPHTLTPTPDESKTRKPSRTTPTPGAPPHTLTPTPDESKTRKASRTTPTPGAPSHTLTPTPALKRTFNWEGGLSVEITYNWGVNEYKYMRAHNGTREELQISSICRNKTTLSDGTTIAQPIMFEPNGKVILPDVTYPDGSGTLDNGAMFHKNYTLHDDELSGAWEVG